MKIYMDKVSGQLYLTEDIECDDILLLEDNYIVGTVPKYYFTARFTYIGEL